MDAHCEKSKRFNLRLFRVLRKRHSKCEEVAQVVETQRIERVCKNVVRDFQNLLVANEYCRKRFRRTYFRRWINTIVRVRHTTAVAKDIHGRRVCRFLRMWKRARVDKARELSELVRRWHCFMFAVDDFVMPCRRGNTFVNRED